MTKPPKFKLNLEATEHVERWIDSIETATKSFLESPVLASHTDLERASIAARALVIVAACSAITGAKTEKRAPKIKYFLHMCRETFKSSLPPMLEWHYVLEFKVKENPND